MNWTELNWIYLIGTKSKIRCDKLLSTSLLFSPLLFTSLLFTSLHCGHFQTHVRLEIKQCSCSKINRKYRNQSTDNLLTISKLKIISIVVIVISCYYCNRRSNNYTYHTRRELKRIEENWKENRMKWIHLRIQ